MERPTDPPDDFRARLIALAPELAHQPWQPLAGGQVNRVWRLGDLVVKKTCGRGESPLFPNSVRAEAAALLACAPRGLAPRLRAQGDDFVVYHHVDGPRFSGDPLPVAGLLARLHGGPVWAGLRPAPMGTAALRADALRVARGVAGLPPMPHVPEIAAPAPCAIHADPVPGNIILHASGPVLIDWQCPALGDAAEDLAMFLSPAMQMIYGERLEIGAGQAFLRAYGRADVVARYRALAPLYHWRMAAHCLWRAGRGGGVAWGRAAAAELAAIGGAGRA